MVLRRVVVTCLFTNTNRWYLDVHVLNFDALGGLCVAHNETDANNRCRTTCVHGGGPWLRPRRTTLPRELSWRYSATTAVQVAATVQERVGTRKFHSFESRFLSHRMGKFMGFSESGAGRPF